MTNGAYFVSIDTRVDVREDFTFLIGYRKITEHTTYFHDILTYGTLYKLFYNLDMFDTLLIALKKQNERE